MEKESTNLPSVPPKGTGGSARRKKTAFQTALSIYFLSAFHAMIPAC